MKRLRQESLKSVDRIRSLLGTDEINFAGFKRVLECLCEMAAEEPLVEDTVSF